MPVDPPVTTEILPSQPGKHVEINLNFEEVNRFAQDVSVELDSKLSEESVQEGADKSEPVLVKDSAKTDRGSYGMEPAFGFYAENGVFPLAFVDGNLDIAGDKPFWNQGSKTLVENEIGEPLMEYQGENIVSLSQQEGTAKLPNLQGIWPTHFRGSEYETVKGFDSHGRTVTPADRTAPILYNQKNLGFNQVFSATLDPETWEPVVSQVTFSQSSDIHIGGLVGHKLNLAMGGDFLYPVGGVKTPKRKPGAGKVYVVPVHGQSNAVGAQDGSVVEPVDKIITVQPTLPGRILCVNGGTIPHQDGHSSPSRDTPIDPSQYSSLVDAREGINPWRESETPVMGAVETIAREYDSDAVFVVVNWGHGSSKLENLIGSNILKNQAILNFEAILQKIVDEADSQSDSGFEAVWGREVEVLCDILIGHESNYVDAVSIYQNRLNLLETRVDEWKSITGQTSDIPICILPPAAAAVGSLEMNNVCSATVNWVKEKPHRRMVAATYSADIGNYATTHFTADNHRLNGELAGSFIANWVVDQRVPSTYMESAEEESSSVVVVTLSEPCVVDTYGCDPVSAYGFRVEDDAGSHTPETAVLSDDGLTLTLTMQSGLIGSVKYVVAGAGVEDFGSVVNGMGRKYGFRTNIRAIEPVGFSVSSARPHFKWVNMHKIEIV